LGSLAHPESFEAQQSNIESGDGSGDDVHFQVNSPASPAILETHQTNMDSDAGSNGDEVTFVRSQKRKRPSLPEQNRSSSSQDFEAQQSQARCGDGNGDEVIDLGEDSREWSSVKRVRRSSGERRNYTKNLGGMFNCLV